MKRRIERAEKRLASEVESRQGFEELAEHWKREALASRERLKEQARDCERALREVGAGQRDLEEARAQLADVLATQDARKSPYVDGLLRRKITVHTKSGHSIDGVLIGAYADCVVLAHASYPHDEGPVNLDGDQVLPRASIDWMSEWSDAGASH